ncbi:MAG: DUF1922 domain-containing protein [Promethearchaeota archaeon]
MKDVRWKRDKTPYIVFACSKCKQFMYAKQTQKSKKCLRCGLTHKIPNLLSSKDIIHGMTNAVERVKEKQHELAIQETGSAPEFSSFGDFKIQKRKEPINKEMILMDSESEYIRKFNKMLMNMEEIYTKVPYYVFEIFAENYAIPESELNFLIHLFQKKGVLIKKGMHYFINLYKDQF